MLILAGVAGAVLPTPAGLLSWEPAAEAVAPRASAQAGSQAAETPAFPSHQPWEAGGRGGGGRSLNSLGIQIHPLGVGASTLYNRLARIKKDDPHNSPGLANCKLLTCVICTFIETCERALCTHLMFLEWPRSTDAVRGCRVVGVAISGLLS